jgi:flagellar biogenesis protein FliO
LFKANAVDGDVNLFDDYSDDFFTITKKPVTLDPNTPTPVPTPNGKPEQSMQSNQLLQALLQKQLHQSTKSA